MTASTMAPDHNEPAPTRLLDADLPDAEVLAVHEDNTGLPMIGRRSVGYQQRVVFGLTVLGIVGLIGAGAGAVSSSNSHALQVEATARR